jgi:flavin-dependent dehydrogenase
VKRELFIVGGGPAGLAAAIAARQRGFHVTVADGAIPPADKACGEGLMPDGLLALAELGIKVRAEDSFPFRGIRFVDRGKSVAASFPNGPGCGVRRTTLHRFMVERAESVGVKLCWGKAVDTGELSSRNSQWIIGADGGNSQVRKWAGLDQQIALRRRYGFRRHYRIAPWSEYVEIYWGDSYQIYVTPVAPDSVCVAIICQDSQFRLDDALRRSPELAQRLGACEVTTSERGGISASRRLQAVCSDRVALVGDASGSVDAITGEGLCLAFREAVALAAAMEQGDLAEYQAEHRRIAQRPEWMARLLLGLGDHSAFRSVAMHAMTFCPPIFDKMLAVHVGAHHKNKSALFPDPVGAAYSDADGVGAGDDPSTGSGPDTRPVHAE